MSTTPSREPQTWTDLLGIADALGIPKEISGVGRASAPAAQLLLGINLALVIRPVRVLDDGAPVVRFHYEAVDMEGDYLATIATATPGQATDAVLAAAVQTARAMFWDRVGPTEPDLDR